MSEHRIGATTRLRNYFLTGFIICAPLAITAYLAWSFVLWVDGWVKPYLPDVYNPDNYLPFAVPGFGLIVAIFLITTVGFLTANFVGMAIVSYGENLLDRTPLVRSLYRGLKQLFETILSHRGEAFQKVALIEYPRKGVWSIVFVSSERSTGLTQFIAAREQDDIVACFLPCAPNPTTGFLMYMPRRDVFEIDMKVEDAAKLVISCGMVTPEMAAEAESAKRRRPEKVAA